MKCTRILLLLEDHSYDINKHKIAIKISEKLASMGLGEDICFDEFLSKLQLNEKTYILALHSTLQKPTLLFKQKPNDIQTNVYGKHVKSLWEANTKYLF